MEKYIIILAVITFLFRSLLGCGLTTKRGSQEFDLSRIQISMSVNLAEYINQSASNKDTEFNLLISKMKNDHENAGEYFSKLLDAANQQKIDLKKYFNFAATNNETVIGQLKSILGDDLKQDSITFYSRMLTSGAQDIKITIHNQSIFNIELIIDTVRSPLKKIYRAILDTSRVEFRAIRNFRETVNLMKQIEQTLTTNGYNKTTSDSTDNNQLTLDSFEALHPLFFIAIVDFFSTVDSIPPIFIKDGNYKVFNSYLNDPRVKKIIPENLEFLVSTIPTIQLEEEPVYNIFCVNKQPSFYGNVFVDYSDGTDSDSMIAYVNFRLKINDAESSTLISDLIKHNLFLIKYVNMIYFSPLKISQTDYASYRIDGFVDMKEAYYIRTILLCGRKTLPYRIL